MSTKAGAKIFKTKCSQCHTVEKVCGAKVSCLSGTITIPPPLLFVNFSESSASFYPVWHGELRLTEHGSSLSLTLLAIVLVGARLFCTQGRCTLRCVPVEKYSVRFETHRTALSPLCRVADAPPYLHDEFSTSVKGERRVQASRSISSGCAVYTDELWYRQQAGEGPASVAHTIFSKNAEESRPPRKNCNAYVARPADEICSPFVPHFRAPQTTFLSL